MLPNGSMQEYSIYLGGTTGFPYIYFGAQVSIHSDMNRLRCNYVRLQEIVVPDLWQLRKAKAENIQPRWN